MINNRKKIRTDRVKGFYSTVEPVADQPTKVTGTITVSLDDSSEFFVFRAQTPVDQQLFQDRFNALETQLSEKWFEVPFAFDYQG